MSLKRTKFMSSMLYLKSYMDKLFDTKANKTDVESLEDKVSKSIEAIGLDENKDYKVEFHETNNLDDCDTIIKAILKLDSLLKNNEN